MTQVRRRTDTERRTTPSPSPSGSSWSPPGHPTTWHFLWSGATAPASSLFHFLQAGGGGKRFEASAAPGANRSSEGWCRHCRRWAQRCADSHRASPSQDTGTGASRRVHQWKSRRWRHLDWRAPLQPLMTGRVVHSLDGEWAARAGTDVCTWPTGERQWASHGQQRTNPRLSQDASPEMKLCKSTEQLVCTA